MKNKTFDTVYFGGGTPSLLSDKSLTEILESLYKNFDIKKDAEITSEGNPSDFCVLQKVKFFKSVGINRLSIGIQTMNGASLKKVGRLQTVESNTNALKTAAEIFDNVSADVMLALPDEGIFEVEKTLRIISGFGVGHISAYALKVEEATALFENVKNGLVDIPSDDAAADCYDFACEYLKERKTLRYEISNFAKNGLECRHNLNYWRGGEYLGLGAAAHSFTENKRYENPRSIIKYRDGLLKGVLPSVNVTLIEPDNALYEKIMLGLRLSDGINISELNKEYKINFLEKYSSALKKYEKCFKLVDGKLSVKDEYFYSLNSILVEFL